MPIEIIKTDITEMQVDAIVNAANPSLIRMGGLCGAVFQKAGFELDKECNQIGHCNTGEAVITKGYALKAKYIIHTVAPIWNDFRNEANREELFRNCYHNIFKIAIENNIKTIAIPCINPHKINVNPAPCHIPLTKNTIKTLLHVLNIEYRLPPREKYI